MSSDYKFELVVQADTLGNVPMKAHENDAAYDLYAAESMFLAPGRRATVSLGIKTAFDGKNYVAILYGRSGLASKNGIDILGGVIDGNYRGTWKAVVLNTGFDVLKIQPGDRICQVVFHKRYDPEITLTDNIEEAGKKYDDDRGANGMGSTGV